MVLIGGGGGGFLVPHSLSIRAAGLGLGEGLGLRPLYIKRGGGAPTPYTFPSNPSRPAALLSPSRLLVGEALLQKFSTIYTTPSCYRSNPSLHHTCWSEEGGYVEVLHVCISPRHRHLWC